MALDMCYDTLLHTVTAHIFHPVMRLLVGVMAGIEATAKS